MRIKEKSMEHSVEVYALYWAQYNGVFQRFHLVIPEDDYPGFLAVPEEECEVVDPSLTNFVLIKNPRGGDALVHPVLQDQELLNKVSDHDEEATKLFLTLVS